MRRRAQWIVVALLVCAPVPLVPADVNWRREYSRSRARASGETSFYGLLTCRVRAKRGRPYDGFDGIRIFRRRPIHHAPELMTRIAVGERNVTFEGAQDRYQQHLGLPGLRLTTRTELSVVVQDRDIASNDLLARLTLRYEDAFPMTAESGPISITCRGRSQDLVARAQRGALRRLSRDVVRIPEAEFDDRDADFHETFLERLEAASSRVAPLEELLGEDAEQLADAKRTIAERTRQIQEVVAARLSTGGSAIGETEHERVLTPPPETRESPEEQAEVEVAEERRVRAHYGRRRESPQHMIQVRIHNANRRRAPAVRLYRSNNLLSGPTRVYLLGGRRPRLLRANSRLPRGDAEIMIAYYGTASAWDTVRLVYRDGSAFVSR